MQEKPENIPVFDLGSFWRVFAQIDLCLHCIVPFIYTLVALSKACEKVKVIGACKILQTFPRLCLRLTLVMASSRIHTGPCQSVHSKQSLFCIFVVQTKLQAHTYFHISNGTLRISGKAHHYLSSPFWGPQCKA